MDFAPEGPKAIPLWINGHAYLTVTESFFDVIAPASGEAVRRVPLSGADEAATALASARAALPGWAALAAVERKALLAALAAGLERYAGHFAGLVGEETGCDQATALAEVAEAVEALRDGPAGAGGVAAVVVDASRPLVGFAATAAPLLRGGATVVVKPSPRAPSAAFALCELSARASWPAGVINLVHGDADAIAGLCAAGADSLVYAGEPALGTQVAAIAVRCGTPFIGLAA